MTLQPQATSSESRAHTRILYIPALDGVRALSICLVLAAHMLPLGPSVFAMNAMAGTMGMSLFFCLSGFLIVSMLHHNPDVVTFLTRRVLRIVPALALYLVISMLLVGTSGYVALLNMLFVSNYLVAGLSDGPMGHLWSLAVEMHFYLSIAMLTLILGRRSVWLVPPAAVLITLLRVDSGTYLNINTHLRVDEILSGGVLALVVLHYGPRIKAFLTSDHRSLPLLCAATLLWILSCRSDAGALNYLRPYLAATVVGLTIYCQWQPLRYLLESRLAAYIARISYALYIYHILMIWGWMNTGGDWERYLLKRPVSFALTFAAAHASTFWWEDRWQKLAKSLTKNRSLRTS